MKITIRNETETDYRAVEELTREAFWNLNFPGCSEHYLIHVLRSHADFIPELDLVAEADGKIVGSIIYSKSKLTDEKGNEKDILTFGPLSVSPEYQRKGIGKALIEHSFIKAAELGYDTVVIFGSPSNYISRGFKSCKKYNVSLNGYFPTAMLVKEIKENALDGRSWNFSESSAFDIDENAAEEFDKTFESKEKAYSKSQEEFFICSHSSVN